MATVKKRKGENDKKVRIKFDVPMLNVLIKYLRCEYISQPQKANLFQLIKRLDLEAYRYEPDVYNRLQVLRILLGAIITENIADDSLIVSYLSSNLEDNSILSSIDLSTNKLTISDCEYVSKSVLERLQYLQVYEVKDDITKLLANLDNTSFEVSYYSLIQELKTKMSTLMTTLQSPAQQMGLLREFSFDSENFAAQIGKIIAKRKKPTSILQSGIRQLNAILSPGFQSGRLYTILGGSGRFKSGTLLNIADQIRRFNPQIKAYENGFRKCILFVTLENSIEETVERLYDMYSDENDDIRDREPSEVIQLLRDTGEFKFTDTAGIDIVFRYFSNLEIDTSALLGMVNDLHENGKEPIAIVLDYIKRIESVHPSNGDERIRMSFVSKELKAIAQFFEIPIITAMQLNREGNSIIDAAMRENKQDVARFVGASSIGNAWDIIEDSDWVCLINLEYQKSTGQLFLTFKRLKIRGKTEINGIDYFNHPFVNAKNIRLEHDVDKDRPASVISLASDLESIVEKDDFKSNKPERPRVSDVRQPENYQTRVLTQLPTIPLNMIAG